MAFTLFLLLVLCSISRGGVVTDIVDSLDTEDEDLLKGIHRGLSDGYISDASTVDDLRTLIDDVAQALDLGSNTRSELEREIASVLDSDKIDNSLGSDTCSDICDVFNDICDDTSDDSYSDWVEDDCEDDCRDDGYEGMCYCCLADDLRCTNKDMTFILETYCAKSLFGYCGGDLTMAVGDCQISPEDNSTPDSNIIREILGDLDSDQADALDDILDDLSSDFMDSVSTLEDLRTILDELESDLDLGSGTMDDLEDAFQSILDGNSGELSTGDCERICSGFSGVCDDFQESSWEDWRDNDCVDDCGDDGREHSCFCCDKDFDCIDESIDDLLEDNCYESLVGLCQEDDQVQIGDCFIADKKKLLAKMERPKQILADLRMKLNDNKIFGLKRTDFYIVLSVFASLILLTAVCVCTMPRKRDETDGDTPNESDVQTNGAEVAA